jgi:hypothetical protein
MKNKLNYWYIVHTYTTPATSYFGERTVRFTNLILERFEFLNRDGCVDVQEVELVARGFIALGLEPHHTGTSTTTILQSL